MVKSLIPLRNSVSLLRRTERYRLLLHNNIMPLLFYSFTTKKALLLCTNISRIYTSNMTKKIRTRVKKYGAYI